MAIPTDVLFISSTYLKRVTPLSGAIDDEWIAPAITLAQDKYVQMYLGTKLYDKLRSEISGGSVAEPYATLLDTHVVKVTAWWTMVELLPNLYAQIDNGGLILRSATNALSAGSVDMTREVERARRNAQFYTHTMYRYLTDNTTLFPEYGSNSGAQLHPEAGRFTQNGYSITHRQPHQDWRRFFA